MNTGSFDLLLGWVQDAVYETEAAIPNFFDEANKLDGDGGFRDA